MRYIYFLNWNDQRKRNFLEICAHILYSLKNNCFSSREPNVSEFLQTLLLLERLVFICAVQEIFENRLNHIKFTFHLALNRRTKRKQNSFTFIYRCVARLVDQLRLFKQMRYAFQADEELKERLKQRIHECKNENLHALASENSNNFHLSSSHGSRKFHDAFKKMRASLGGFNWISAHSLGVLPSCGWKIRDLKNTRGEASADNLELRPGQTINVGQPNMLGEPTFYRLATVFDDHSTCWMRLEHVWCSIKHFNSSLAWRRMPFVSRASLYIFLARLPFIEIRY